MQADYDVVVVGAGPAGLMVAKETAGTGLKVLMIDQKEDIPRVGRTCCSALILEPGTHGETVTAEDGRFIFKKNGFSVAHSGSLIPLEQYVKISPGRVPFVVVHKGGHIGISYDKDVLLADLLKEVEKSGAEVQGGVQAIAVENEKDRARVTLRRKEKEWEVTGRTVAAADGVNSRMVESLGLNRERTFFATFNVASYHLEGVECPYPPAWISFVGSGHTNDRGGQLYMLPKPPFEGGAPLHEISCGSPATGSAKETLDWFLAEGPVASWFKRSKVVHVRAACLNFRTPIVEPVAGRVVVVGDAAAFIETYNQGAMLYGFQAARAIIEDLASGTGFQGYVDHWKRTFGYNQPGMIERASQGFGLHVLEDEELDYLFSLTKDDVIEGYVNEFSDPDLTMNALMAHIEQIRQERPDLAKKLEGFTQVSIQEAFQISE